MAHDPARRHPPLTRTAATSSSVLLVLLVAALLTSSSVVVAHAAGRALSRAVSSGGPAPAATAVETGTSSPDAPAVTRATAAAPTPATAVPPTRAPMRAGHLVLLGDSVPAAAACQCAGFGADLARALPATLTNAAVSGQDSSGLVHQLDDPSVRATLRKATVVTVTTGANDFDPAGATDPTCTDLSCYAATLRDLSANLDVVVRTLRDLVPADTTVVLTGYWNVFLDGQVAAAKGPTYAAVSTALTRAVNSTVLSHSAGPGIAYADLYQPFKGAGDRDDTALLAADGDHPDAAGHHLIAATIRTLLAA